MGEPRDEMTSPRSAAEGGDQLAGRHRVEWLQILYRALDLGDAGDGPP
jgi:hypothetical protein